MVPRIQALLLAFLALQEPAVAVVNIPSGFSRILFVDDFSTQAAGSQPSTSKWSYSLGTSYPGGPANWGTHEVQSYTSSTANIVITNSGTLRITPVVSGGRWTSARIESLPSFDFACPAGGKLRIEASLKFGAAPPSQQMGIWPSLWTMGSAVRGNPSQWPAAGELDVAESINGQATSWQVLHCGRAPGGPCNEYAGIGSTAPFSRGVFHTVAAEIDRSAGGGAWQSETLAWFVDGRRTAFITGAQIGDQAAWTAVSRGAKFILMNVAVGGDFPDNVANDAHVKTPTAQTVGGVDSSMEVRYVAVFST